MKTHRAHAYQTATMENREKPGFPPPAGSVRPNAAGVAPALDFHGQTVATMEGKGRAGRIQKMKC